ncbi:gluconokinase [Paenibacillus sp. LHD-117]|uniref:gluconokinase n=1 Tax=Paenibacillus sp. LHD-117 TaxID=3071412 RepID=UPI0027E09D4B|nr:gluconokinase [Paenibacillus sp. LHD-117]MDQ6421546.1 gluconokinase [Paenibacillus sp. LHD-117]
MKVASKLIISIDIGTTSTKTLAVDQNGRILGTHSIGYPLHTPQPGHAEQDPEQMTEAVVECVSQLMKKGGWSAEDILCASFSSANHSVILMDEGGGALTPVITWADLRSASQAGMLNEDGTGLGAYLRSGTPIHPMSPLVKLIWMRENRPELMAAASHVIGIKEYVFYKLFGRFVTDYSMASATGLFNVETLDWDPQNLAIAGIRREQLPELMPSTGRIQGLKPAYADRMGLSADTTFVLGGQDGVLANLGIGAIEPGVAAVTIGTSSAVRTAVKGTLLEPEGRLFCYALADDHWIIGGASNNGAIVAQWTAERLFPGKAMEDVIPLAAEVPAGSNGLFFLPLLAGERAPFWDGKAKGVMFGLTLAHSEKHMLRAAMEGIMYQIAAIVSLMKQCGNEIKEIRASGGFARSAIWCQMLADILGVPVTIPESVESSGLGAAQLGLYAMEDGKGPLLRWNAGNGVSYEPDMVTHGVYRELLPFYLNLYQALKPSMHEMDRLPI